MSRKQEEHLLSIVFSPSAEQGEVGNKLNRSIMFLSTLVESIGDFLAPINPFADNTNDADANSGGVDPVIIKRTRLEAQKKAEELAESKGVFAKKQRVRYHNKSNNTISDAVVVGVHYDDGPDKPYYVSSTWSIISSNCNGRQINNGFSIFRP